LALLAGRQSGAFAFAQALKVGYPRATISRRLASGAWARLHPGVYAVAATPVTRELELWAALLAAGPQAVLSHESALLVHGAEDLPPTPITLTNPHGLHHRLDGVIVHQIDDLAPRHRKMVEGMPISKPARSVVEVAATCGVATVGRVADDLVRAGRTSYAAIATVLADVARPGKPGVETVAAVLDARTGGYVPPASELERLLFATLEAGGLPAPVRQARLPGRGPVSGLVDGAYLDARIVLEADGRRWHTRMDAARRDRERDAQVVRAGWVPLRFLYEQLRGDPGGVCEVVADTRALRLDQLRRAA
jgi:hypothetical protein